MENRFGVKDFFIFACLLTLIVLVVLGMIQVDRQWDAIRQIKEQGDQHTRDLVSIERTLGEGISFNPGAPTTQASVGADTSHFGDPFRLMKQAEKSPGFVRGDWLVDNLQGKLKAITPFIGNDVPAAWVQGRVMESLLYRDVDTLEFVPLLAKSWQPSPDGLTITFQLRRGVTFSDGEPFTADDVVFTFDWILNKNVNAPRERGELDKLVSVTKDNDYQVTFKFSEFYFKSLETVGNEWVLAKHFYSKYTPQQFNETPGLLIGTGAYRMPDPSAWKPGQRVELIRNERYWGDPPAPDRLIFLEVEEEAAEQTMFTNGELDVFSATKEQYVKLKQDPRMMSRAQAFEFNSMMAGYLFVAWNELHGGMPTRFADKRMRQAMTMLVDRDQICQQIFLSYATVATGPFGYNSKQADPSVKPWPYDPAAARKVLGELGYADRDGSGVIKSADGTPLKFKLTYPSKMATYDRLTLLMKDDFARAGVVMERDPVDWPLLQQKLDKREFDAVMLNWSGNVDDDPRQMFDSSQIADQGDNFMSYSSSELDHALMAARTCVDPTKRTELWHKVHKILADDCPYTFLVDIKSTVFFSDRIGNIQRSKIGLNRNLLDTDPYPWFIYANKRRYSK